MWQVISEFKEGCQGLGFQKLGSKPKIRSSKKVASQEKVASKLRQEGQEVCVGCRWEQEKWLVGNKRLRRSRIRLQCRRPGLDPWVGKIPWRREWQSTPVFLPGESHEQRSLEGFSPWGRKESDTTERLHLTSWHNYKGDQVLATKRLKNCKEFIA